MGFRNREKEFKAVVEGAKNLKSVEKLMSSLLVNTRRLIRGKKADFYWRAPKSAKADFIRLRRQNGRHGTFTIKYSDKRSNLNRVEKDNEVQDFLQMYGTLEDIHGKPQGSIEKIYTVYFLGKKHDESSTAVSIYRVVNDSRVFIEIEARTTKLVHYWTKRIAKRLPFRLERERRSLYQIFIKKQQLKK